MVALNELRVPYLIFVPKNGAMKRALAPKCSGAMSAIEHEFTLNRDRAVLKGEITYALSRQIDEKWLDRCIDWAFATNQREIDLDGIAETYRRRWNIETWFRVLDDVTIKSKSRDVGIRFFLFAYEQALQLIWVSYSGRR